MRIERGDIRDLVFLAIVLLLIACIVPFRDDLGSYFDWLLLAVIAILVWTYEKIMVLRFPEISEAAFERRYLSRYEDPLAAVHRAREATAKMLGVKASRLDPDADLRQVCRAVSLGPGDSVVMGELRDALEPHQTLSEGMSVADYIHRLVVAGQANQAGHR